MAKSEDNDDDGHSDQMKTRHDRIFSSSPKGSNSELICNSRGGEVGVLKKKNNYQFFLAYWLIFGVLIGGR